MFKLMLWMWRCVLGGLNTFAFAFPHCPQFGVLFRFTFLVLEETVFAFHQISSKSLQQPGDFFASAFGPLF